MRLIKSGGGRVQRLAAAALWFFVLFFLPAKLPAIASPSPPPRVTADAAILVEWRTGQILLEKNAHQKRSPASLTKVMTALLALEKGRLEDIVTISPRATQVSGSRMYLRAGQKYTLGDLLQGLLLKSGNDAALAIAEHIGGSVEGFVQMMNDRARSLGAWETEFKNPHGLTTPGHYSSAFDLALLARYALNNPVFAQLVASRETEISELTRSTDIYLRNTNRLLWGFAGADGVKTGTTSVAGNCLLASATRGATRFIAVVLHSDNRWRDSVNLLDYGFANFSLATPVKQGDVLAYLSVAGGRKREVALTAEEDLVAVVAVGEGAALRAEVDVADGVRAPVERGQRLGTVTLWLKDKLVGQTSLVAVESIPPKRWAEYFLEVWQSLLQRVVLWEDFDWR
ncbi:MAG: D-alanyl-D-alanine carboxypeptidase [Firmicutes bacterium]|nr:D-alanyl-D-alanine carboxypeptidase [Bacillota bacterium]